MINTIKILDDKTMAMTWHDKTIIVTKRVSTLGLSSWFNYKGEIYA
jgi:hypothetical protein